MGIETVLAFTLSLAMPAAHAAPEGVLLLQSAGGVCAATVLDDGLHVATAYHCVNSGRPIQLSTATGEAAGAVRWATNRKLDLAVLRLDNPLGVSGLSVREGPLVPGEPVVVYGHPFYSAGQEIASLEGLLAFSQAHGFVSAVGPYLTQLDVAFNPGISGGPVVDEQGRVAGVASRKLKGEQLSFSAPSAPLLKMVAVPTKEKISGALSLLADLEIPLSVDQVSSFHLTPRLLLWDWIGLEGSAGWELGANWQAVRVETVRWNSWKLGAFFRVRVGQGPNSFVADIGGQAVGEMVLTGSWEEERLQMVREQGAVRMGPNLRFGWKGWTFATGLFGTQGDWTPTVSVGTVVAPQMAVF